MKLTEPTRFLRFAKSALLVCLVMVTVTGCSSAMHGYTKRRALDRYLIVDPSPDSLGARRLRYIEGFRSPMRGFVDSHGTPDFIFEFKEGHREGVRLYYVERNIVYVFIEYNWQPNSIFLREERPLTDYEKATYRELKK